MKRIATLILLLAVGSQLCADEKKDALAKQPAKEKAKAAQALPPKSLEEAHQQLEKLLPKKELVKIDAMKTEGEMIKYHFGPGMGMRNGWGLWGGGPLAQHMNKLGFHHPDDMSAVILETFWCKRHKKDFRLKERAAYYEAYWKAAADPPRSARDPKDGSVVDWNMSFGAGEDESPRQIHAGKSMKTGRWLAYEYDKGVYEPNAALLKRTPSVVKPSVHPW
ncbi:MAG: hypothetical protein IPK32_03375 [Verrucomicrobiaceae bacterium]|nr:hypothetical protein [Verrucomicrobiaceae bacterium]